VYYRGGKCVGKYMLDDYNYTVAIAVSSSSSDCIIELSDVVLDGMIPGVMCVI
jgi:hypothetical protein